MLFAAVLTAVFLGTVGQTNNSKPEAAVKCKAHQAIKFYAKRISHWNSKMGARPAKSIRASRLTACPRYHAKVLRAKAYSARKAYVEWREYHFHWWKWLPDKWQRIGRCETGHTWGRFFPAGNWQWNSGTYQGSFGFYHGTWDQYKPSGSPSEAYLATPRQQYQAALNVYAEHGYGAWGCGGA